MDEDTIVGLTEEDHNRDLVAWSARVAADLRLEGYQVDAAALLEAAAATSVSLRPPAGPLAAYLVGFAAGRAAAAGEDVPAAASAAVEAATRFAALSAAESLAASDVPPTAVLEEPRSALED
ncbi:DUF6457 domain-containing protein [Herbiconiux solani]|uniref:DUF6457 domain-containing protein n=1 Tax=Herbiconiux solani TaxID=661329 RepID=UPI000826C547|nr:DUF6457 domain-containing protein [Herbiconiux solani]